jgi:hypothetical protein
MDDGVAAFMRAMNDGFPAIETMSVSDARAVIAGRRLPVDNLDDVAGVDDRRVAGPGGDIPVRIYRPHGRNENARCGGVLSWADRHPVAHNRNRPRWLWPVDVSTAHCPAAWSKRAPTTSVSNR